MTARRTRTRRNPIINPKPGDLFVRAGMRRRFNGTSVTSLGGKEMEWVLYCESTTLEGPFEGGDYVVGSCSREEWDAWAKGARV